MAQGSAFSAVCPLLLLLPDSASYLGRVLGRSGKDWCGEWGVMPVLLGGMGSPVPCPTPSPHLLCSCLLILHSAKGTMLSPPTLQGLPLSVIESSGSLAATTLRSSDFVDYPHLIVRVRVTFSRPSTSKVEVEPQTGVKTGFKIGWNAEKSRTRSRAQSH